MIATVDEQWLEACGVCPVCARRNLIPLDVPSLNAREPARIQALTKRLGSDFFARQALSICADCTHVFQSTRPTRAGLRKLYDEFSDVLEKVVPSAANMVEYVWRHNPQDYVGGPARALAFLEAHELLAGRASVLEVRTYGGALAALLRERGVPDVEAAYLQDFDAHAARALFGLTALTPFSFVDPIDEFRPRRQRYDLIVMYEGLTHAREPRAVLRWLRSHLEPGGVALLLREPNTPRYRRYFPLSVAFNNFHQGLFSEASVGQLMAAEGLACELHEERHPKFPEPLYLNLILRPDQPAAVRARRAAAPVGPAFYRAWIREEKNPIARSIANARRGLRARLRPLFGARSV